MYISTVTGTYAATKDGKEVKLEEGKPVPKGVDDDILANWIKKGRIVESKKG